MGQQCQQRADKAARRSTKLEKKIEKWLVVESSPSAGGQNWQWLVVETSPAAGGHSGMAGGGAKSRSKVFSAAKSMAAAPLRSA